MKQIVILTIFLAACAKAPPSPTPAASLAGTTVLSAFNDTTAQEQTALLRLMAVALSAGTSLESARAERCWRHETNRPVVRESCVLLWAGGSDSSALLEEAIISGRSRLLALALLSRAPLLVQIGYPQLLTVLDQLQEDPLWLKAELTLAWLKIHGRPGIKEANTLVARIRPAEGAGPRDLAASLTAIQKLRVGTWQEIFGNHCDPATRGEARLRCWRLLGALASKPGSLSDYRSFLPTTADSDWTLFTRTFPRLARKIQATLR